MMEFFYEYGYWGLFLSSFISATILPLASEAVLVALLANGKDAGLCLALATVGNFAGSMTGYALGYWGHWKWLEKLFRLKKEKVLALQPKVQKQAYLLALFSWLPIVGDLFPVCLGYFKYSVVKSSIFIFIGKFLRYFVLAVFVWNVF